MQSALGVQSNCLITRVSLQEQVYQISNTDHIVYSPFPITTQIVCNNGSYFNLKIKNTKQIHIPEGCSVDLTNHTITSDFNIRTTSNSVHFEWDFDPLSIPNSAELMMDAKTIDFKLDQIRIGLALVKNDTIDDAEFDQLMLSHYSSGSWISVLIISILSVTTLAALTTLAYCFRNYFREGGRVGDQHHPPSTFRATYKKGYGSDDEDEDILNLHRSESPPPGIQRTESRSTTA